MTNQKVFILGIDGMPPELIFEKWKGQLPNFSFLMEKGIYAKVSATVPPTSIASWTSMFSGLDPGSTGIYGYMPKLSPPDYQFRLVQSGDVHVPRIWDRLSVHHLPSIIFNVPMTFPVTPLEGVMISDFMTPGIDTNCMYPLALKEEIKQLLGQQYIFDISEFSAFRNMPTAEIVRRVYEVTEMRFKVIDYLRKNKPWNLCVAVIDGSDRLNHTLWRYQDETHERFEQHQEFSLALFKYYQYLDEKIGVYLKELDEQTTLIVTSDHGINPMRGRINLNDWFWQKDYLSPSADWSAELKTKAPQKMQLAKLDWTKTKCYVTGAYEGLIFINKKGRDIRGIVEEKDYEAFCDQLIQQIEAIPGKNGERLRTRVMRSRDLYPHGWGDDAPDLVVYFDDLFWGTNADLGNDGLYSWANIVGPDDSLHSAYGTFLAYRHNLSMRGRIPDIAVKDIAPTIASILAPEILNEQPWHGAAIASLVKN